MEYIQDAAADETDACIFCDIPSSPREADRILARGDLAYVVLNKFPYNPGHLMVAPRAHVGSLTALTDEQVLAVMRLVQRSQRILERIMSPEGFNIGVNVGRVAGAGIPDHVHVHMVPRWNGDTNFLPVLSEVKVVNEHLERTWEKLTAAFAE